VETINADPFIDDGRADRLANTLMLFVDQFPEHLESKNCELMIEYLLGKLEPGDLPEMMEPASPADDETYGSRQTSRSNRKTTTKNKKNTNGKGKAKGKTGR
jgi:hypothetical protein